PGIYTKLFLNEGGGNFIENPDVPFEQVFDGDIATSDIDGDGDMDLLICGWNASFKVRTSLYINQGNGTFLENADNSLEDISNGEVAFCDVDGDSDQDVFIVGQNAYFEDVAKLYLNDGEGVFEEFHGTHFMGVRFSAIGIGDFDNDNDQDVIISGSDSLSRPNTQLYINQGNGAFNRDENSNFQDVFDGTISLSDVDGDADQDILITGWAVMHIAKLYINNGQGAFSQSTEQNFLGVRDGSTAFVDVDSDSDEDLLITGLNSSLESQVQLYTNDGSGKFMEMVTPIKSIYDGVAAFSDIDGDNDSDLLIIGRNSELGLITTQYINESAQSSVFKFNKQSLSFKIYPNPVQTNEISIFVTDFSINQLNIKLYNLEMQLVIEKRINSLSGGQKYSLSSLNLSQGWYIMIISDDKGNYTQKTIIVI
ncbi:MAG: FG-GAP-like repeat-containing protein, partial [Saprospiraceae bacterium]